MIHKIKALYDNGNGSSIKAISQQLGISRNIGSLKGLSRMRENLHVRFLGEPESAMTLAYPTTRHSAARNGRRAEKVMKLSFPASASVKYTDPWERLARENCNWDHSKIADAFRSFCAGKSIRLEAKNIETLFITFCKKQPKI